MNEIELRRAGGRILHAYDMGGDGLPVFWQHGTPNIGLPPEPLFAEGIRWVSHDRPGYGGSARQIGRTVGSAAGDVEAIADALGIKRFAVMGHSGGGSHALACGALLPDRVIAVISAAGIAPYPSMGLDWFAGMVPSGVASLTAATQGLEAKTAFENSGVEYDHQFTKSDMATLEGPWKWLGRVASAGMDAGPGGLIDDDLAYVNPWGCDPRDIKAPILLLHGDDDGIIPSSHGEWLAAHCPTAQLRPAKGAGHLSVLDGALAAMWWLREAADE